MRLDLGKAHSWIKSELARRRPVVESMNWLIDQCKAEYPHPDWDHLRSLPYANLSPLLSWIEQSFRKDPPVQRLKGLWFGLFNPYVDDEPVADIHVCGSEFFDPTPGDNFWAVKSCWRPQPRGARSVVLANIYRIAHRFGGNGEEQKSALKNVAEYPLCLGYGTFAVQEILGQISPTLLLGQSDSLGIAVGFDAGDFLLLGELTGNGMRAIGPDFQKSELPFEQLLNDLHSTNDKKVFWAIVELQRSGDRAREAIHDLVNISARYKQFGVRQAALSALAKIAPDDPLTKAVAMQSLKDPNPFVRCQALRSLISIKELSLPDLAEIKNMENDSDKSVSNQSEITLRNIALRSQK